MVAARAHPALLPLLVGLAGAVAVGALVQVAAQPASAPLAALGLALGLVCLVRAWPARRPAWAWGGLVAGCAVGMACSVMLAVQIHGQDRVEVAVESAGFELMVGRLLEARHCPSVVAVLHADLEVLDHRPVMAAVVRRQAWDQAASLGCVKGPALARAHGRLSRHVATAVLPPGLSRSRAQALLEGTTPLH